jgi:hypothetical protein
MRADFACLGKCKRDNEGIAPTHELPVGSKRCPVCGSKRLQQIFNNPNVIARSAAPDRDMRLTSDRHFVRSSALLRPGFDHAAAHKPASDMRSFAMPVGSGQAPAPQGKGRPMTEIEIARARRSDTYSVPSLLRAVNQSRIPTNPHRDPRGEQ